VVIAPTKGAWTEGEVDADGVRLRFHRTGHGDAPPLVLAHGLSDNGLCWTRVARTLENDFDIVMIDARNHGMSATAPADADLLADDVVAVVSALELDRPALIGHSVGAHTMADVAGRHPDAVSRLVLEDPPWTADREVSEEAADAAAERREAVREWLESFADMTDAEIAELGRTQHGDWPAEEFPAWIRSNRQVRPQAADGLFFGRWSDVVDRIACPALLIHGEQERGGLVTSATAQRVRERNGFIASHLVAEAGHNLRRENFDEFIDVVSAFLRRT
jgi:pimeloyl-ACP methyl ester carboxylesterase